MDSDSATDESILDEESGAHPPAYDAVEKADNAKTVHDTTDISHLKGTGSSIVEYLHSMITKSERPYARFKAATATFAFGPDYFYYFSCWTHSLYSAPTGLKDADIAIPLALSFGRNRRYFIAGLDYSGSPSWSYADGTYSVKTHKAKQSESQMKWSEWTSTLPLTMDAIGHQTVVTFGEKDSYYATSSHSTISHGLPYQIEKLLDARSRLQGQRPRQVALGVKGSYVILWPDDDIDYDLKGLYPVVRATIESKHGIAYIALSAFHAQGWYIERADGPIAFNLPKRTDTTLTHLTNFTCAMMQQRATRNSAR
ncbi:hypothetical protein EJ05DRAFT_499262 [Pseudovirgaria hyperparasitica]|uniref:Uncharacterized protein n=1 Tax=Pseudovirgaria hyperparasitica TaxID=470096 RepID=A0A6A6WAH2_9PEZI|nr:uncharacterized protein EJ05DRAFT_499262 [Pseudovirgaria hyperparasitica]KAF2758826.1 hypothetical protein EJ05DRAFT_499262 [Pseudovirgaria hyperparasitica]